jgi:hypothetical protein
MTRDKYLEIPYPMPLNGLFKAPLIGLHAL